MNGVLFLLFRFPSILGSATLSLMISQGAVPLLRFVFFTPGNAGVGLYLFFLFFRLLQGGRFLTDIYQSLKSAGPMFDMVVLVLCFVL